MLVDHRERSPKRPQIVAAALAAVALAVFGAGVYAAAPRSGQLAVNVTDAHGRPVDHVKVFVDGKEACASSPCIQTQGAGFHQVKVVAEGYDPPADQAVAVGAGQAAAATFALVASAAATPAKTTEIEVVGSPPSSADRGGTDPVLQDLVDETAAAAASTPPRRLAAKPAAAPPPAPEGNAVAYRAPASSGSEGFLNINSIPSSNCFLDGRPLGSTPRSHISVRAGTHVVKFVNTDQGLTKVVTVRVGRGETKPAIARLK